MRNRSKFYPIITVLTAVLLLALFGLFCDDSSPIVYDNSYTLTTFAANGSITKYPDKPKYPSGDTVKLTAVANTGYTFLNWSGDTSGTNETTTVTMNGNKNVRADFNVIATDPVTDIDGNVYNTIRIGKQVWTVENLRTTKYNDGTPVTLDTSRKTWADATTAKYCYYNNTTTADSIKN
jgi:uncharacterized repeat protein (TIGR02543 family)